MELQIALQNILIGLRGIAAHKKLRPTYQQMAFDVAIALDYIDGIPLKVISEHRGYPVSDIPRIARKFGLRRNKRRNQS